MRASIILIFSFFQLISAQQSVPISKTEILNKVLQNNHSLKITSQEFQIMQANYKESMAVFLPNIKASHTGIITTNPLMAFGSKLNQGILQQSDFNPSLLNNPSQTRNFATNISIKQPLINIDGMYQRKAAKATMIAAELKTLRTKEYLTLEVEKVFMQLQLAYKVVTVFEKVLITTKANKELVKNRLAQGYLQKSDLLAVEVRLSEIKTQLQTAKSNIYNISNYLSFLMGENKEEVYKPTSKLSITFLDTINTSVSKSRADIKAMELATKAYQKNYQVTKMSFLPRLNAFGSYELYDSKIFNGGASGYIIGIQLSWDVFKGAKRFSRMQKTKATYEKSKIEYEQYLSKNQLTLNKVKRQLSDIKNRIQLTELAVEQSGEELRIRKNRFKEGLEKSADLLLSETKYAQKQLEYYQSVFEYNYTRAYFQFLTKK